MAFEINPVRYVDEGGEHEVVHCAASEAEAWGIYRRLPPDEVGHELAEWVQDCASEQAAQQRVGELVAALPQPFHIGESSWGKHAYFRSPEAASEWAGGQAGVLRLGGQVIHETTHGRIWRVILRSAA